jgi:hypothetical protein
MAEPSLEAVYIMAQAQNLTAPIVGASTSFHRNRTPGLKRKELQNVAPPQSLSKDDITFLIRGMYLKEGLRQIQTDRANLAHGRFPACGQPRHLGTLMPSEGASIPSLPNARGRRETPF